MGWMFDYEPRRLTWEVMRMTAATLARRNTSEVGARAAGQPSGAASSGPAFVLTRRPADPLRLHRVDLERSTRVTAPGLRVLNT